MSRSEVSKKDSKKGSSRFLSFSKLFGASKSKKANSERPDSDVSVLQSNEADSSVSVLHHPTEDEQVMTDEDETLMTDDDKLMKACAEFAVSLYKNITATSSGNQFFSPFSISMALAMTYLGARGETHAQMKSGMSYDKLDEQQLHKAFADLRSAMKGRTGYTLHVANRLFGEKTYSFLDDFLEATQTFYEAPLCLVDFKGDLPIAVGEVNGWVEEQTRQKIKDIVPLEAVDSSTCLILVNAIYFKGDWVEKFDANLTKEEDFYISKKEKAKVQLMYKPKEELNYGVNRKLNCQALELPYVGDKLSMFILLPDHSVTSVEEFESHLTADHLINVRQLFQMQNTEGTVWLPRFKLLESIELSGILNNMGMKDMFSAGVADFSGMDGGRNLSVSKVLHKAFVDVNEEGSEAAAATAVVMVGRCLSYEPDPFTFRADHPFIFFILDNSTKAILFLGKFQQPQLFY